MGPNTLSEIEQQVIDWYCNNNIEDRDHKIINGDYVALIHHDKDSNSGFSAPVNAMFTVPATRKALVIKCAASRTSFEDPGFRGLRLVGAAGVEYVPQSNFRGAFNLPDGGTDANGKIPEIPGGETVQLDTWNNGTAERPRGGFVILKVI